MVRCTLELNTESTVSCVLSSVVISHQMMLKEKKLANCATEYTTVERYSHFQQKFKETIKENCFVCCHSHRNTSMKARNNKQCGLDLSDLTHFLSFL